MIRLLRILIVILFLALPSSAYASFALVGAYSTATSGSSVNTPGFSTIGANLIVVLTGNINSPGTLSDSQSNTWTPLTTYGTTVTAKIYYCYNPVTSASHSFTLTDSSGLGIAIEIAITAWSGSASSPFDVENGAASSSTMSQQTGNVSPSQNSELIITHAVYNQTNTPSIDSGFTIIGTTNPSSGNYFGISYAYLIQTSAAAVNPTWSLNTQNSFLTTPIATFKASGAVTAVPQCNSGIFLLHVGCGH